MCVTMSPKLIIFQAEKREDLQAFVEMCGGTPYLLQAEIAQQNCTPTSGTLQTWIKVQIQVSVIVSFLPYFLAKLFKILGLFICSSVSLNMANISIHCSHREKSVTTDEFS